MCSFEGISFYIKTSRVNDKTGLIVNKYTVFKDGHIKEIV